MKAIKKEPTIGELFDLSGRVALITGASGHLGRALANTLAEAGARVVVASRKIKIAHTVCAALTDVEAGPHLAVAMDQMDETSIQRGFQRAVKLAGRLDILVNNGHEPITADWRSANGKQFTRQLANCTGYFLLARLLRDHAVKNHRAASIVMLGSMYGLVGSYPDVYADQPSASPAAYHALKGSIVQLTRHLAVYWAKDNVRVNCLSPGPFPSPAAAHKLVKRLCAKSPMNRVGEPHELKGALAFLSSDASSYVTGQNLMVDGGWTSW